MSDKLDDIGHSLFDSKEQRDKRREEKKRNMPKDTFQQTNSVNQQVTGDARNIALNRNLKLFEPINELLSQMYGPGFKLDLDQFKLSPMDEAQWGPGGKESVPLAASLHNGYNLGYDPTIQPEDGADWCRVCGLGPSNRVHGDPNLPNHHEWQPPDSQPKGPSSAMGLTAPGNYGGGGGLIAGGPVKQV